MQYNISRRQRESQKEKEEREEQTPTTPFRWREKGLCPSCCRCQSVHSQHTILPPKSSTRMSEKMKMVLQHKDRTEVNSIPRPTRLE